MKEEGTFTIDESNNWSKLSEEKRQRLMSDFLKVAVNKRCEVCMFYARTMDDVIKHAGENMHGFANGSMVLQVAVFKQVKS